MRFLFLSGFLLAAFFLTDCQSNDYESLKQKGIASGKRNDGLLFNLHFGMTKTDFFAECLKLNQAGKIMNGPQNMTAMFTLPGTEAKPIDLNFYPDFCQNKICVMKMNFGYQAWSPWGKEFHSEALLPEAVKWIENEYKVDLKKMDVNGKKRLVAIGGNREITVWLQNEQYVNCFITDLTATPDPPMQPSNDGPRPIWEK
jgi:hypothetical protein